MVEGQWVGGVGGWMDGWVDKWVGGCINGSMVNKRKGR